MSAWQALEEDNPTKLEAFLTTYAPYFKDEKPVTDRSEFITDEHLEYLDELHSVAMINMYGAGINLREEFDLTKAESRTVLSYWMKINR